MYAHLHHILLGSLANAGAVLLVAPLCEGVIRKVTARVQSRQGPPLLQPYFDLLKLLGKEDIESGQVPAMQRVAAYAAPAVVLTAATLLPLGFASPMNPGADVILLIYLLSLSGICVLLAGLAAGSTYSLIGTSREMMTMIPLEPLFGVAVLVGAVHTGTLRLDTVLGGGSVYHATGGGVPWSGLLLLAVVLMSFQGFIQRLPFDTTEAETEIMEGPLAEYSGPKLALLKWSAMARLVIHASLFVALFMPWGASLPVAAAIPVFWVKVLAVVLAVTLIAATHARYRVDQAVRYFAALLLAGTGALVLACLGYQARARRSVMSLMSKLKETAICLGAGRVTLPYPAQPRPAPANFRGRPVFDASRCIGCAGCANNCPAREILVLDVCQEIRVLKYLGRRCTYCGRCADVCPEHAITMSAEYQTATDRVSDLGQRLELFMSTCQRCGRCFAEKSPLDRLKMRGYRFDDLANERWCLGSKTFLDTDAVVDDIPIEAD